MKELSPAQLDLIERFGVLHDLSGLPPAAGRVIGLLLVAPEGELTFDEIRGALGLSKSATSTTLRLLQEVGSVVYRTKTGDRKRYFRKNTDDWERRFVTNGMRFLDIRFLLAEAIELHDEVDPTARRTLGRMTGFLDVLAEAMQDAHDRWAATRPSPATPPES